MNKPSTLPESQSSLKDPSGEFADIALKRADLSTLENLSKVTRLLVEHPHTQRADGNSPKNSGSKFPFTILSLTSEDYDYTAGTGYRVSYSGVIDRASRDAMDRDPVILIVAGSDQAIVPVAERLPMYIDAERLKLLSPNELTLASRLATEVLSSLEVQPTA